MPGLTADHPLYVQMKKAVYSEEGKRAALRAVKEGRPPLCEIEPLLIKAIGTNYDQNVQAMQSAGFIVSGLMRCLGYKKGKIKKCGAGCVTGKAPVWVPN